MTIRGQFVWGIWTVVLLMQMGHALYLRNENYAVALVFTGVLGFLACFHRGRHP